MDLFISKVNGHPVHDTIYSFQSVGEGIVWSSQTPGYTGGDFIFKVKGEKHVSGTSITGITLSGDDKAAVINFCLEVGITMFEYEFSE